MLRNIVEHVKMGRSLHFESDTQRVVLHNGSVNKNIFGGCCTVLYCMAPPFQGCTVYCAEIGGKRPKNPIAVHVLADQFCYAKEILFGYVTLTPALPELTYKRL